MSWVTHTYIQAHTHASTHIHPRARKHRHTCTGHFPLSHSPTNPLRHRTFLCFSVCLFLCLSVFLSLSVKNRSLPPWITVDIRQAMKQRDRFKKQKNYPQFKKQRRHVKYLLRQAKKTYFEKILSNQTGDTCLVWKALNALTKNTFSCKQNIPSTLTVEVFNDHFLSLATV